MDITQHDPWGPTPELLRSYEVAIEEERQRMRERADPLADKPWLTADGRPSIDVARALVRAGWTPPVA